MVISEEEYQGLDEDQTFIVFRSNWVLDHPNYSEICQHIKDGIASDDMLHKLSQLEAELYSTMLK